MSMTVDFIRIETLFNSVEAELVRRWSMHNVPEALARRPVAHIRRLVKAWWQIYHESACAGQTVNRTFWERRLDYPAYALGTTALVKALQEIYDLTDLDALAAFRPLKGEEEQAFVLLVYIKEYYTDLFPEIVRSWLTNVAIFTPMDEQNLSSELTNEQLRVVAINYQRVQQRAMELLPTADQSLLSGSAGTAYLKQKRHRALTEDDIQRIIRQLGSADEKQTVDQFTNAQLFLSGRIKNSKWIKLITEQSGVPYLSVRRRFVKPALWTPEEMIQIADVLERLRV